MGPVLIALAALLISGGSLYLTARENRTKASREEVAALRAEVASNHDEILALRGQLEACEARCEHLLKENVRLMRLLVDRGV